MLTLGSLFDGSGGFPLAASMCGIKPVWASEIEKFPIEVTKKRFPEMVHLGDILKIDGAAIEPVDVISFGSPCQDLSMAGTRSGLVSGERSKLFFESIRIIKEMLNATNGKYPAVALWENVPGAFTSNKGEDFRIALQSFCQIKDGNAIVPKPKDNKWGDAGAINGNGYSLAWRVLDAQFFGVPQRRRRIFLCCTFSNRGQSLIGDTYTGSAAEILFKRQGLSRNFESCRETWQRTSGSIEDCIRTWGSK